VVLSESRVTVVTGKVQSQTKVAHLGWPSNSNGGGLDRLIEDHAFRRSKCIISIDVAQKAIAGCTAPVHRSSGSGYPRDSR